MNDILVFFKYLTNQQVFVFVWYTLGLLALPDKLVRHVVSDGVETAISICVHKPVTYIFYGLQLCLANNLNSRDNQPYLMRDDEKL